MVLASLCSRYLAHSFAKCIGIQPLIHSFSTYVLRFTQTRTRTKESWIFVNMHCGSFCFCFNLERIMLAEIRCYRKKSKVKHNSRACALCTIQWHCSGAVPCRFMLHTFTNLKKKYGNGKCEQVRENLEESGNSLNLPTSFSAIWVRVELRTVSALRPASRKWMN